MLRKAIRDLLVWMIYTAGVVVGFIAGLLDIDLDD